MKIMNKALILASCAAMLLGSVAVSAEVPQAAANNEQKQMMVQPQKERSLLHTSGKIVEVNDKQIVVKGTGDHKLIAVNISEQTYILDGDKGKAKKMKNLKVGRDVTVYYSPVMTRSLPPQTAAIAVLLGEADEDQGRYMVVDQVEMSENQDYITLTDQDYSLIATVDKQANKQFAEIKSGDRILVWYDMMTMSLPARTNAVKVVVLPNI